MKFSEALAAIKALDNGSELASAIEGEVEGLKSKNYEIIGEKRNVTTKAQTLETTVMAIAKVAGIEGDLESVLAALEPKVRESLQKLTTAETKLTEAETRATEAQGKLNSFERKAKLSEIATAAGANPAVLEKLLGDKFDQLKVEGEGDARVVKLGDKPLKEAVAADESLKLFEAALFPAASASPSPAPSPAPAAKLPGGSPHGKTDNKKDLLSTYSEKNYGGAKALNQKAAGS
ncbi:hypothetical protein [Leptolyngbya ohadii]|uniref:hypothetical protein n=1 Tax=Leptolyngbya ohadii TaxID=1962290 RepID=UPI000B59BDC6|nr:hypothetical protein [Leptolyngbya ohadii]